MWHIFEIFKIHIFISVTGKISIIIIYNSIYYLLFILFLVNFKLDSIFTSVFI